MRQVFKSAFSRVPGVFLVLILATILYLSVAGFPSWFTTRLMARINDSSSFVMNFKIMKLSPLHMELIFEDVRLYRKRVLGPAAAEVGQLIVSVDIVSLARKEFSIDRIRMVGGLIRPQMLYGPDVPQAEVPDKKRKAMFAVELEDCVIQGVNVVCLSADLTAEGALVRFDNIGGSLSRDNMRGDVSGMLVYNEIDRVLDGHLLTQFDPRILVSLINEWEMPHLAALVSRFDFYKEPPKCEVTFKKINHGSGDLTVDGRFSMSESSYRGVDILRANGRAHVELAGPKAMLRVEIAELVRKEGVARTTFTADLNSQMVSFDGMSGIHAPSFFQLVGVFTNECAKYFRFDGPVKIAASGVVDYGSLTNTNFRGIVETERMGIGPLMTDSCSFSMTMAGLTTTVTGVKGKLCGGDFAGSAVFVLPDNLESNISYAVDANLESADFHKIVAAVMSDNGKTKYSGKLGGRVKVSGFLGDGNGKTAVGSGYVFVSKGHVFTLPVFGGLTEFITKYVPVIDFMLAQTDAKADFSILNGKVSTREVLVEGGVITLSGTGDYYFDRNLDFNVKVRLLKKKTLLGQVVQFVTDPISELFEFRLKGTLSQPEWSALHL